MNQLQFHHLVESVQRCVNLSAYLPSPFNVHICTFIIFCKGRQFHQFGSQFSVENHCILTMHCPAAAWAASQDDKPPCYIFGAHFVFINASPGHKLIFQTKHCSPNSVAFTQYNNSQCICGSWEVLDIVQWNNLTPSWILAQVGCSLAGVGSVIVLNFTNIMLLCRKCVYFK